MFPQDTPGSSTTGWVREGGATLLDFYAGKALAGMLAAGELQSCPLETHASTAFDIAEAMMVERAKRLADAPASALISDNIE
jgi:hypothetical protein